MAAHAFRHMSLMLVRALWLCTAVVGGAVAVSASSSFALKALADFKLEDYDCDHSSSSLVNWLLLRQHLRDFDSSWKEIEAAPLETCKNVEQLAEAGDASAMEECPLGAVAAIAVNMVCAGDCGEGASGKVLGERWKTLLRPQAGDEALQRHFILGTTSWPVASVLAKWAMTCKKRGAATAMPSSTASDSASSTSESASDVCKAGQQFVTASQKGSTTWYLQALLANPAKAAPAYASHLTYFATDVLKSYRLVVAAQEASGVECSDPLVVVYKETFLAYLRLMGPPTLPYDDPMVNPRSTIAAEALRGMPPDALLRQGWVVLLMLAALRHVTWRAQRLFTSKQVTVDDIRQVVALAAEGLHRSEAEEALPAAKAQSSDVVMGTKVQTGAQRQLWQQVASKAAEMRLAPIWKRTAEWLLAAPAGTPDTVVVSMAWGFLPWVRSYVRHVLFAGVPRFAFITPDMLSSCLDWAAEHPRGERLLCVKATSECQKPGAAGTCPRPYDTNNYAKFFLMPLLLTLGVDVLWLDLDVWLLHDPVPSLREMAYGSDGRRKIDVLTG
eukprot:TRINITY_DN3928_c0_g1_i5.p1 TRINITY_DN3928_c0_g1~~TRINITY_DN3928_c0_g1_i5.p1  ORF type:complete len:557 (-),score=105.53 TRINITY_DN3928_c0_g1_i5:1388-3058(-)